MIFIGQAIALIIMYRIVPYQLVMSAFVHILLAVMV